MTSRVSEKLSGLSGLQVDQVRAEAVPPASRSESKSKRRNTQLAGSQARLIPCAAFFGVLACRHILACGNPSSLRVFFRRERGRDLSRGLRSSYSLPPRPKAAKSGCRAVHDVGWLPKPESATQQERIRRRKNTKTIRHRRGTAPKRSWPRTSPSSTSP